MIDGRLKREEGRNCNTEYQVPEKMGEGRWKMEQENKSRRESELQMPIAEMLNERCKILKAKVRNYGVGFSTLNIEL